MKPPKPRRNRHDATASQKTTAAAVMAAVAVGIAAAPYWLDDSTVTRLWPTRMPEPGGWHDTGQVITTDDTTLRVYARKFPAGRIELGANECQGSNCSMYTVFLKANPCPWDLNGDGNINVLDAALIKQHIYSSNPAGDVNSDGAVNALDRAALMPMMYKTCAEAMRQ